MYDGESCRLQEIDTWCLLSLLTGDIGLMSNKVPGPGLVIVPFNSYPPPVIFALSIKYFPSVAYTR